MTFWEFIKSRRKKAVLFFLAGFFAGGILNYLCRKSAGGEFSKMEENLVLWASQTQDFWQAFLFLFWERGKVFSVLWLAGYTKIYRIYIRAFITYAGIQAGFLLTFFIMLRGVKGVVLWLASGFPHLLLLLPLYLYSFYRIFERRRGKIMPALLLVVLVFAASCVLEARVNIPLFRWMFTVW